MVNIEIKLETSKYELNDLNTGIRYSVVIKDLIMVI